MKIRGIREKTKKGNYLIVGRIVGTKHYFVGSEFKDNEVKGITLTKGSFNLLRKIINGISMRGL